jgi:hypothetical protein
MAVNCTKMLKYLFIIVLLIVQTATAQQNITPSDSLKGTIVYRQKINMGSPAIKFDTLKFDRTKSIFEWNLYPTSNEGLRKAKEKYPNAKVVKTSGATGYHGQVTMFDTKKDSLFSRMDMERIGKLLFLKEKPQKLVGKLPTVQKWLAIKLPRKLLLTFGAVIIPPGLRPKFRSLTVRGSCTDYPD